MIYIFWTDIYRRNKFIFVFGLVLLNVLSLGAQNKRFNNIHRKDGLTSNKITSIHQDGYGYMWFGTKKGLNRYDGVHIDPYLPIKNDTTSLSGFYIYQLFSTSTGKLIIKNEKGIDVFDYKSENFNRISSTMQEVVLISEDQNKNILISYLDNNIIVYDKELNYIETIDIDKLMYESFKISEGIGNLLSYDTNNFVFHVKEKGFFIYNIYSKRISLLSSDTLPDTVISKVLTIDPTEFWVGTTQGVYVYKNGRIDTHFKKDVFGRFNSNNVSDLQKMKNHEIWIFTKGGGIHIYNLNTRKFSYLNQNKNDEHSIASNFISTTFIDHTATLWVGNVNNGISQLLPYNHFRTHKLIMNKGDNRIDVPVSALFMDSEKRLWIGSRGNGLYQLEENKITHIAVNENIKNIRSLQELSSGNLLIGTFSNGVSSMDILNKKLQHTLGVNQALKTKSPITSIIKNNNAQLWIASEKVLKIDNLEENGSLNSYSIIDEKKIEVMSMHAVSKDVILCGSRHGLYIYLKGKITLISSEPKFIVSILKYKKDKYWLATDNGICLVDIGTSQTNFFGLNENLNDVNVKSLISDNSNNLWLGTPEGISKFNITTKKFTNYTYKDGFLDNSFSRTVALKSEDGTMYFGGFNGLLTFHPDSIRAQTKINKVLFTKILINHKEKIDKKNLVFEEYLADVSQIKLQSHQKLFTINYSSFHFKQPEKITFSYILEGYDKQWKSTSDRSLTFMNLEPGEYTLKIKASSLSGEWASNYSSLKIIVLPAWWQTYWFYSLVFLLTAVIIYLINKVIFERQELKRKFEYEKDILEKQKDLDEQQLHFFTNLSHEIRTPLTLVLGPIEDILKREGTDKVYNLNLIQKNALRIKKLINRGIDFRKTQFKEPELQAVKINMVPFLRELMEDFKNIGNSKGLVLSFDSNVDELLIWVDIYMMETIFYNLISNAIKYSSSEGKITLKIRRDNKCVYITVQDFGSGIVAGDLDSIFETFYQTKEHVEGSGIGLALVKSFVEVHKGSIGVQSELGKGSCFEVKLLLGDKHINKENIIRGDSGKIIDVNSRVDTVSVLQNNDVKKQGVDKVSVIKKTILLVEDQIELLQYLEVNLHTTYVILKAQNGLEAMAIINKCKIDLVISDVMMPQMNGFELCRILKADKQTNSIPFILLTAKTLTADKIEGYETGADAYIEKPFQFDLLKAIIQNLFESSERQHHKLLKYLGLEHKVVDINSADDAFYSRVISILEKHIDNPKFDIPLFVKEIGMSKSVVYRRMSVITDISINDLMHEIRLNKSSNLLLHTNKTVLEIATMVGFSNAPYFSTSFKKKYSKTPSNFRKDYLNKTPV